METCNQLVKIDLSEYLSEEYLSATFKTPEQSFEWMYEAPGVLGSQAQFDVCPIWRYGLIREVFIFPVDQPDAKNCYIVKSSQGFEGLDFGQFFYEYDTVRGKQHRVNFPIIWKTYWCGEHKTQAIRLYVPKNSKSFFLSRSLEKLCFNWK